MKTTVDYLRFRARGTVLEGLEALRGTFGPYGPSLGLKGGLKGYRGWDEAAEVRLGQMVIGRVDFGGESQRGWNRWDFGGRGLEWVQDWEALQDVEALPDAELRRLDVALTTWNGEITHETVVAAHAAGRFVTKGRPPTLQTLISTDPMQGRTCYVGSRTQPKFFRAYEKGLEMAAKMPEGFEPSEIDGSNIRDIYRCELELKASDSVSIPWETIERRDQYFAGAYPFCADVLPGVEADILKRRKERSAQQDLQAALANCRKQFGKTLFTALHAYHGDICAVFEKVVGDEHSLPLLEAGVLMVDHE